MCLNLLIIRQIKLQQKVIIKQQKLVVILNNQVDNNCMISPWTFYGKQNKNQIISNQSNNQNDMSLMKFKSKDNIKSKIQTKNLQNIKLQKQTKQQNSQIKGIQQQECKSCIKLFQNPKSLHNTKWMLQNSLFNEHFQSLKIQQKQGKQPISQLKRQNPKQIRQNSKQQKQNSQQMKQNQKLINELIKFSNSNQSKSNKLIPINLSSAVNAMRKDSPTQLIGQALINHQKKCFTKDINKLLILKFIHQSLNIEKRQQIKNQQNNQLKKLQYLQPKQTKITQKSKGQTNIQEQKQMKRLNTQIIQNVQINNQSINDEYVLNFVSNSNLKNPSKMLRLSKILNPQNQIDSRVQLSQFPQINRSNEEKKVRQKFIVQKIKAQIKIQIKSARNQNIKIIRSQSYNSYHTKRDNIQFDITKDKDKDKFDITKDKAKLDISKDKIKNSVHRQLQINQQIYFSPEIGFAKKSKKTNKHNLIELINLDKINRQKIVNRFNKNKIRQNKDNQNQSNYHSINWNDQQSNLNDEQIQFSDKKIIHQPLYHNESKQQRKKSKSHQKYRQQNRKKIQKELNNQQINNQQHINSEQNIKSIMRSVSKQIQNKKIINLLKIDNKIALKKQSSGKQIPKLVKQAKNANKTDKVIKNDSKWKINNQSIVKYSQLIINKIT